MTDHRIHIVHVVGRLGHGGAEVVALDLCRSVDPGRFRSSVVTLDESGSPSGPAHSGSVPDAGVPADVEVAVAPFRDSGSYSAISYWLDSRIPSRIHKRCPSFGDMVGTLDPDILHFHTNPRQLPLAVGQVWSGDVGLVFTDHVARIISGEYSLISEAILRSAYRRFYRPFHVISVGAPVERASREAGLLPPDRFHLLHSNQVDLDRYHPPDEADGADTRSRPPGHDPGDDPGDAPVELIYVARLGAVKGHETLLRAFRQIRSPRRRVLTLVGNGPLRAHLESVAAGMPDDDAARVRFLGVRDDVPDLLRRAAIGVFPSSREGRPLALMEMMATELPVVASDIPEIRDILTDGVTGLLVPPGDVDAWTEAMDRILADPALRTKLGRAARAALEAEQRVDPVEEVERFYDAVLAHG